MQQYFNPRSPHGEQRQSLDTSSYHGHISIHAPRMGSDNTTFSLSAGPIYFNPRPRMGSDIFVSSYPFGEYIISIHAPRMGSDCTVKAYSNDRIKRSTLREPHFLFSKNTWFSPIVSMFATTSRTKKSENQSFIRIISRLGTYVFHLRLVSIPQIIEPYAVRLLVHQHFQCGTK